jgi:hypothetical protein
VLYPMVDIGFIQGEEFKVKTHNELLPSGGSIYDFTGVLLVPKGPMKPGSLDAEILMEAR